MKVQKMNIYEIISAIWKNCPNHVTIFSECECGRSARRGSYPCITCLRDRLIKDDDGVHTPVVDELLRAIIKVREVECELIELVGEDAEL